MRANSSKVKSQVTAAEWQCRVDLAACARLLAEFKIEDFGYNHILAVVPDDEEAILVTPFGIAYDEIQASDFIKINRQGDYLLNPHSSLFYFRAAMQHMPVLNARRNVKCLIHSHAPACAAVSMLTHGLLPYHQSSMRFANIPYHDYGGAVIDDREGSRLVKDLGDHEAVILRNHGVLVVGNGIPQAFNTMFYLNQSCTYQVMAGNDLNKFNIPVPSAIETTRQFFDIETRKKLGIPGIQEMGIKEWPMLTRHLDRHDDSYKQ